MSDTRHATPGSEKSSLDRSPRATLLLVCLGLCAVAILAVAPFIGMLRVSLASVFSPATGGVEAEVFWQLRVPRVLTAFLAGCGLAVSGMAFQALFRNPLATPFTLGVASGASLGAAVTVRLGLAISLFGFSSVSVGAFLGACAAILLVYGLSQVKRGFSTGTMLLAGVAVSFFFSSLILFVQYTSDLYSSFRILRWLMGGLSSAGAASVYGVLPFVVAGVVILTFLSHELNLLTVGEDLATSRGVNVKRARGLIFFATSLMVGGVVARCGPIGFVGMMVPHMCRLLIGPDHRHLTAASILFGGIFLTVCDTVARTVIAPTEIPVGVITAFLGGPFFLWLLLFKSPERFG